MSEEFAFVKDSLEKVKTGDPNRAEIQKVIEDFKNAVKVACITMCNTLVSFEPMSLVINLRRFAQKGFPYSDTVSVYQGAFTSRLELFKYEMNPINGYPIVIRYGMRSVRCENKTDLMLGIRAAYDSSVGVLRDWCENGGRPVCGMQFGEMLSTESLSGGGNE